MLGINSLTDLEPATVTIQAVTDVTVLSIKLPLITEFIKKISGSNVYRISRYAGTGSKYQCENGSYAKYAE